MTSQIVERESICRVIEYNANYTACDCEQRANWANATAHRRLSIDGVVNSGAYSVSTMTEFVVQSSADTFKAAKSFTSAQAIGKAYVVICLYSVLWGLGGVLIIYMLIAKYKMKQEQKVKLLQVHANKEYQDRSTGLESKAIVSTLKNYLNSVIPKVFSNLNWVRRLSAELTIHHGYINLIADLIHSRPAIITVFQIETIFTINLFLIALLYDLNYPNNNGSCPGQTTLESCLAKKTIFSNHQSYCVWNRATSSCYYQAPQLSFQVALYCAVVVSIFNASSIRPLEYLLKLLANPTAQSLQNEVIASMVSRARSTVVRVGRRVSNAMQQFSNAIVPERSLLGQRVKTKVSIPKETAAAYHEFRIAATDEFRAKFINKRSHIATMLEDENIVDHYFSQFEHDFNEQRSLIPLDLCCRFDKLWHVDKEREAFTDFITYRMMCFVKRENVIPFLQREIVAVKELAKKASEELSVLPDSDAGIMLLQLFVADMLGRRTVGAKIFSAKAEADFERSQVVSYRTKLFVLGLLLGVNAFCIYYTMLKGYVKGYDWQKQYAIACTIQIVCEVAFFETLECIWMNFCLPSLAIHEMKRVHRVLDKAVAIVKKVLESDHEIPPPPLNVPEYFFASNIVAHRLPTLPESMIVLSYRTCLPGEILHEDKYNSKINNWTISEVVIFVFATFMSVFVAVVALIPFEVQRGLLRFFEPFLLGGLVLGFVYIQSNPAFLTLFCLLCFIIVGGSIYWYFRGTADNSKVHIEHDCFDEENQPSFANEDINKLEEVNKDESDEEGDSDLESLLELQHRLAEIVLGTNNNNNFGDSYHAQDKPADELEENRFLMMRNELNTRMLR